MSLLEEKSALATAREKGTKEGWKQGIEEGKKKGIEEGKKKGIEEGQKIGIAQGKRNKTFELAKKMKEQGLDTKIIQNITNLTEEEINEL